MRAIDFGVNDFPQVMCIEDFSPYWITSNWTPRRLVTDMKIMKAIGCSCVRFSLYPAMPDKGSFPGVPPDQFLPMMDLAVETAEDLGLRILLDLDQGIEDYGEEGVRFYLGRYKGRIEAYQIGNERYDFPRDENRLEWLRNLLELGHSIDPRAIISADILVPDWVRIRDEKPGLYRQLDVALAHYYSVTDYRGWNDVYVQDLVDHLSNPVGRNSLESRSSELAGSYDAYTQSYDHPFYAGSWAWLDKEVWLTELSSHGYWRWGALVDEKKRASDWQKVVDAIAMAENRVTRIYHHAFRDKMTWREFGRDQSGIVKYDGAPRPVTWAFREMAVKYARQDSPLRMLGCDIPRVLAPEGDSRAEVVVELRDTSGNGLSGRAELELPPGAHAEEPSFHFDIPPDGSIKWRCQLDVSDLSWGNNHFFARIDTPGGTLYGWGIISRPTRLILDTSDIPHPELSPRVRYVKGLAAVQEFLDRYADHSAIITGPALGSDTEMGYRLKIMIESMRCMPEIPVRPAFLASELLDGPIIVVGSPDHNFVARTVEMGLPEEERVSHANPGPGRGLVNVVHQPFGEDSIAGRLAPQAEAIGYHFGSCPAALYIAGPDDEGTKAAAYDLMLRIWGCEKKYE